MLIMKRDTVLVLSAYAIQDQPIEYCILDVDCPDQARRAVEYNSIFGFVYLPLD
jgi:hypothetical protein